MWMNELFNTVFETELRLLILLEVEDSIGSYEVMHQTTAEKLAAIDFIALYSASFGITESNLHGNGGYKFSEFAVRRDLTQKALRELVRKGFVNAINSTSGFAYIITDAGRAFCAELADEYADEYRMIVKLVMDETDTLSERDLASFINRHSVNSLKRS